MRIGILTQPLYANYGGILQNFALQQVLKRMGHTPITLDYMPSLSFGRYLLYVGKGILCSLFPSKRHPIKPYRHFLERPASIDSFVRSNIALTRTIPKYSERILKKHKIEALIVGSDQVWRYSYNSETIRDMYLHFARNYPCLRVAYAASFGEETWKYPEIIVSEVRELAKLFDAVSVRENSGVGLCRDGLDINAYTVLDPTLLLSASDYAGFCADSNPEEQPYLAAYVLDLTDKKLEYIHNAAASKGLKVKMMTVSDVGVSIEDWLSTIKNAQYVITDSYHGCLFSIIFGKQFKAFINRERGADRFVTILGSLNLLGRLIDNPEEQLPSDDIDYSAVYSCLKSLQEKSLSFLSSSLS